MELIDVGVNLTNKSLQKDLDGVIERAGDAGVMQMVVTGTSIEESRKAVDLCNQYPDRLVSTCGVHPHHASDWNQDSFDELGRTLLALEQEYASAKSAGQRERTLAIRRLVIEAKSHARFTLRRSSTSEQKRSIKQEMVEWMIVWLEDPALFAPWAKLRRRRVNFPGPAADK